MITLFFHSHYSWRILLTLFLAVCWLGAPPAVRGQQPSPPPAEQGAVGLKIAPAQYEEDIAPSQPKDGAISVFNISQQPVTVQPEVENARMIGEDGVLEFYIGDNLFRLHSFIEVDKTPFTLAVGEGRNVKFRVSIPIGVYPGGYFGAIFFRVVPDTAGQSPSVSVAQNGRVGSLLILRVPGDVGRQGQIDRFVLTQNDFSGQKNFAVTYNNTGSTTQKPLGVAYRPQGTLKIKNLVGLTVRSKSVTGELVFPGAKRQFTAKVDKPLWLGRYTAELTLAPGEGGATATRQLTFWAISPLAATAIGLLVGFVAIVDWRRRRRRRQGNLEQATQVDHAPPPEPDQTGDNGKTPSS